MYRVKVTLFNGRAEFYSDPYDDHDEAQDAAAAVERLTYEGAALYFGRSPALVHIHNALRVARCTAVVRPYTSELDT